MKCIRWNKLHSRIFQNMLVHLILGNGVDRTNDFGLTYNMRLKHGSTSCVTMYITFHASLSSSVKMGLMPIY